MLFQKTPQLSPLFFDHRCCVVIGRNGFIPNLLGWVVFWMLGGISVRWIIRVKGGRGRTLRLLLV